MLKSSVALCCLVSLLTVSSVQAGVQLPDQLVVETPTTLRVISRGYYPESGTVRSRFIRRVAAANPEIFPSIRKAFDQPLAAGVRLRIPEGESSPTTSAGSDTGAVVATVTEMPASSATPALPVVAPIPQAPTQTSTEAPLPVRAKLSISLPKEFALAGKGEGERIAVKSFAKMIATADEMVRAQRLEENIADEGIRGAASIFEPVFFMSAEREGMRVLNSSQDAQRRGVLPGDIFWSRENRIKTGLNMKSLVGTDVELSYNLSELKDSIQPTRLPQSTIPEYKGYLGVKLTQPLLRGAGVDATFSGITIAETEKGVARETVRQVLSQRVMDGLAAYLMVQRAEARVKYRTQALATAADIEQEITQQNTAGLRSAGELTEARSTLALRKSQLAQAQQDREEQVNALQVFVATREGNGLQRRARLLPEDALGYVGQPAPVPAVPSAASGDADPLSEVLARRPEARVSAIRIEREGRKLDAAREQLLPELNLTLRMGKESLDGYSRPVDSYFRADVPYHSWLVGLNFKINIFGDERKSSEFQTAVYRRQQAELAQEALRQRIGNEVQAADTLLEKAEEQMLRQREIVTAQRELVKLERQLVDAGRRSMLDVRKKQLELYQAEEALADATVYANRVNYLSLQVDGRLLAQLGVE